MKKGGHQRYWKELNENLIPFFSLKSSVRFFGKREGDENLLIFPFQPIFGYFELVIQT